MRQSRNDRGVFYSSVHVLVKNKQKVGKRLHSYPCKLYISMWLVAQNWDLLIITVASLHIRWLCPHRTCKTLEMLFFQKRSLNLLFKSLLVDELTSTMENTCKVPSGQRQVSWADPHYFSCVLTTERYSVLDQTVKHRNYLQHVSELVSTSSLVWKKGI